MRVVRYDPIISLKAVFSIVERLVNVLFFLCYRWSIRNRALNLLASYKLFVMCLGELPTHGLPKL